MTATHPDVRGFLSPFEVPRPEGCEGWESMYPYYALFSEERRESEETRGWFRDGMHFPEPMFPFEFLNLGYAAYLVFYELCKQNFPDIPDQTIAKMVSGIDVVLFRPDDELKRLAQRALDLGVADAVLTANGEATLTDALATSAPGQEWLAEWEAVKTPWFFYSNGNGFYHHHRSWIDDPAVPLAHLQGYLERLRAGDDLARPLAEVSAERDRISAEYLGLLVDPDAIAAFEQNLGLARTVFPYVESHNFYVEHWYHTIFWNKVREFGARLVRHGFLAEAEDVFYLQRHEIADALVDLRLAWAAGSIGRGPGYWPPIVARRRKIMAAMRNFTPPPALGAVPETITEPMTIMLWGITTERVQDWASDSTRDGAILTGFAASPGSAEGPARVILEVERLRELQPGEILVAPVTSPSWTPVFGKIAAAVSDIGGIMSHAAIVSREYGLPAVVGTGDATSRIKTGDRVRVDGDTGTVTILG